MTQVFVVCPVAEFFFLLDKTLFPRAGEGKGGRDPQDQHRQLK
jgi:hypothetical protein